MSDTDKISMPINDRMKVEKLFLDACKNADIEKMKEYLNSEDESIRNAVYHSFTNSMRVCVKLGNVELIKFLSGSPELKKHFNINFNNDYAFKLACTLGKINVIDYLLNDQTVKREVTYDASCKMGIRLSSRHEQLETLEYFRNLPNRKLTEKQLNEENLIALQEGCENGHLDVVKYIFNEPKIQDYQMIGNELEKLFDIACSNQHIEILKFFIFEQNIPKSNSVAFSLEQHFNKETLNLRKEIENCFLVRELNEKLIKDLPVNHNEVKKPKI